MNLGNWNEFWTIFKKFIGGSNDQLGFYGVFDRIFKLLFDIKIFNVSLINWSMLLMFMGFLFMAIKERMR